MPALRELQFAVADAVINPAGTGGALGLVKAGRLTAQARLAVYRNNFHETLRRALALTYPVVEKLVGADCFRTVATRHLRGYPSATGNLIDYGAGFAWFLDQIPELQALPYLPDVARLEWAIHEVLHAPADPPLDLSTLQQVPQERWGGLRLRLSAAARLLPSDYPVLRMWQTNQDGYSEEAGVNLAEGPCRLLVVQHYNNAELLDLPLGEYALLAALAGGATLQQATDAGLAADPTFDLAQALLKLFRFGVLSGWTLDSSSTSMETTS